VDSDFTPTEGAVTTQVSYRVRACGKCACSDWAYDTGFPSPVKTAYFDTIAYQADNQGVYLKWMWPLDSEEVTSWLVERQHKGEDWAALAEVTRPPAVPDCDPNGWDVWVSWVGTYNAEFPDNTCSDPKWGIYRYCHCSRPLSSLYGAGHCGGVADFHDGKWQGWFGYAHFASFAEYVDSKVLAGETYQYRLRPCCSAGCAGPAAWGEVAAE
jgi:hypothetical protein